MNSPAWQMHYRVNQVRNVMVHATPRTLTNRFLPLYPRWTGSHTPHTVQAKKVPRYATMRLTRVDARPHALQDCEMRIIKKKNKSAKNQPKSSSVPASTLHLFAVFFEHYALRSFAFYTTLLRSWILRREVENHEKV